MANTCNNGKKLFIARIHGFCNGVQRALKCVHDLLPEHGGKLYVYNEIVHNSFVVNELRSKGVQFVSDILQIPPHSTVVWSAHGVPPQLLEAAALKNLDCVDATCPLVQKVHDLAKQHSAAGHVVIFIGHEKHPETVGVLGCGNIILVSSAEDCKKLPDFGLERKVVVLSQTTLCAEDVENIIGCLKEKYPALELLSGICYATGERQQAVRELVAKYHTEHILVIGSPNSSNSRRLCEIAGKCGATARLIDDPEDILFLDLSRVNNLGITAGASAPDVLLQRALDILQNKHGFKLYEE